MSVIIKGVEMPSKCRFCPCCADNGLIGMQREYFCSAVDSALEIDNLDQKLSVCTLVEIPTPHGRLIDADELIKKLKRHRDMCGDIETQYALDTAIRILRNIPTIIEAENESEAINSEVSK